MRAGSMARGVVESVSGSLILQPPPPEGLSETEVAIDGEMQSLIVRRAHQPALVDEEPARRPVEAAPGAKFELEHGECIAGPCRGQSLVAVPVVAGDA